MYLQNNLSSPKLSHLHIIITFDCIISLYVIYKLGGIPLKPGKLIGQGRTAEIFEWGEDKILKLFRPGISKALSEAEYKASFEISKKINSSPKVYDFVKIDSRDGIIYERINGTTMLKILSTKPWKLSKEAHRLAQLHKSIQQEVDFELPKYTDRLKLSISEVDLLSDDLKEKLYKYIDTLPDDNILCHGDFHPDNILITKDKAIIIDWMTAAKGNPLADVARTSIMLKFGDVPGKSPIEKNLIDLFRKKLYLEYIKEYINISKVNINQIKKWELPIAAARLIEWLPESEKRNLLSFVTSELNKVTLIEIKND